MHSAQHVSAHGDGLMACGMATRFSESPTRRRHRITRSMHRKPLSGCEPRRRAAISWDGWSWEVRSIRASTATPDHVGVAFAQCEIKLEDGKEMARRLAKHAVQRASRAGTRPRAVRSWSPARGRRLLASIRAIPNAIAASPDTRIMSIGRLAIPKNPNWSTSAEVRSWRSG